MNLVDYDEVGYRIRNKDGELNLKKFKNALDLSLDSVKLMQEYGKVTRKRNFYFIESGKKYTQMVINVNFNYSYKTFNKAGKNTFMRAGYAFKDCVFTDGSCVKDGKLIGIQTNIEVLNPISKDLLGKHFAYIDGCYKQTGEFETLMNKEQLRHYLYENGFVCDGIKYVRYKRSSGSSRVGKCLFVNEVVAERMTKWDKCGLEINDDDNIDLAAWEAYISLPMSSAIDAMEIQPENILVIDDYDSVFDDVVISIEEENGKLVSSEKTVKVSNSIWDGESLMDKSMFPARYSERGMLLLRNRFFKTCAFNANIQQWFADHNITEVSQLKGFTLAEEISQIKLITTPNSIKYLKFGTIKQ